MKKKFVCSLCLFLTLAAQPLDAQQVKSSHGVEEIQGERLPIVGRVLDASGKPVPLATIALVGEDGAILDGCVAGENGVFRLAKLVAGAQSLRVQMLGYETLTLAVGALPEQLDVRLQPEVKTLQAIEVQAENKQSVRLSGTSLTAPVASTSLGNLPSVTHILSALPFVTATVKSVEVQGRGTPIIYYGHRLISQEELLRLDPKDIRDIEVILVPNTSYPAGTPAVIKIKPKSILSRRLGVYTSAEVMKEKDWGYSAMVQGYYDTSKLSLKLGVQNRSSVDYNEQHIKFTITDEAKPTISNLHNEVNFRNTHIALWADAVYRLREGQELGAKYTLATLTNFDVYVPMESEIIRSTGMRKHYTSLMTKEQISPLLVNYANAYYHGALNPQWTIHAEGSFNQKKQHFTQDQEIRYIEPLGLTDSDHSHTHSVGNLWAWRAYTQYAFGGSKLQVGQDGSVTLFEQTYRQLSEARKQLLPDTYNEHRQTNLGFFGSWSHAWLDGRLQAELGLRLESQEWRSSANGKERPRERHLYFFPSASLSYSIGKLSTSLNYENIVRNPNYEALSSEVMYIDELVLQSGNPDLKPKVINRLNLNFGYGGWTLLSSLAYIQNDHTKLSRRYDRDPRFIINREENFDILTYRFGVAYSPKIEFWRPTWSADLYGQDLMFEGKRLNKPRVVLEWKNLLSLPYAFTLQANLWATLGGDDEYTTAKARYTMDLSLTKQFGQAWRIALSVDDVFVTGTKRYIHYTPVGIIEGSSNKRYPYLNFNVSYNFQAKGDRYRGGSAGSSENSRF